MDCVTQIEVTKSFGMGDWRKCLQDLYLSTGGLDAKETVFLFTDTQIVEEGFMEDINNILSSGEVPNLFPAEDLQKIREDMRPIAQQEGRVATSDALWSLFVERVRANLHVVLVCVLLVRLCSSPQPSFSCLCSVSPSSISPHPPFCAVQLHREPPLLTHTHAVHQPCWRQFQELHSHVPLFGQLHDH